VLHTLFSYTEWRATVFGFASLLDAHLNPLRLVSIVSQMDLFDPGHKEVPFARFRRYFPNSETVCKAIDDTQIAKAKQMLEKIPEIWSTRDTSFSAPLVCRESTAFVMNAC
jgi:hypothetical protein